MIDKEKPVSNLMFLFLFAGIGTLMVFIVESDKPSGMEFLIIGCIPSLIGLVTGGLYLLSRIFTHKNNWIITLLGVLLILAFGISALLSNS